MMNGTISNNTVTACYTPEDNPAFKAGLIVLYSVIFVASLLGNTLVIATVCRNLQMRSAVNLFIANMAVSDILLAVSGTPRVLTEVIAGRERWLIGGNIGILTCKLAYFIQDTSLSVSIISLMCITIERFYAVVFPFKSSYLNKHCKLVIPAVWLTAASLHAIYWKIFTLQYDNHNSYPTCYQNWSSVEAVMTYFLVVFVGLFFLALVTTVVMYTIIIVKIKKKDLPEDASNGLRRSRSIQERKLLRVVIAITVIFFACFFPQTVLIIVAPLYVVPQCHAEALRLATKILEQTYSAANPILCITFSANYRSGFVSALKGFTRNITCFTCKSVELNANRRPSNVEGDDRPEDNLERMHEIGTRDLDI